MTPYVSGVVSVYCVIGGKPLLLGVGEKAPRIAFRRSYAPVHSDLSGPILPHDKISAGKEAFISVILTVYNEPVFQVIESGPFPGRDPGSDGPGDDGTLMMTESAAYPVILRYAHYDLKPGMRAAGLVPGKRFACAMLDGEEIEELGTDANKKHLMWSCIRRYDPRTGKKTLYDYNMMGTPPWPLDLTATARR